MIKKYKWPLIIVLGLLAGAFFVHDHFYQRGIRAVEGFSASYDHFDKAISDLSASMTDDSESKAKAALAELEAKAAFRLSSLIRNDGALMNQAREVADLSAKELASLEAYRRAIQNKNANLDELAREYGDLAGKRKAAFARFRQLGGSKD
jgi:hypothetical protein